jgi:hypothetical protein
MRVDLNPRIWSSVDGVLILLERFESVEAEVHITVATFRLSSGKFYCRCCDFVV